MANDTAALVTDEDIASLRAIVARMERVCALNDVNALAWLSVEFHDLDTRLSRNVTAKRIHDSLLLRTLAIRRLSLSQPQRLERSLDNHIQLVNAYEDRDSHLAGAILRANHTGALAAVEKFFRETGTLARRGPAAPQERR